MPRYKIDPYLFNEKEKVILQSLRQYDTPLKISQDTGISRSTTYFVLEKLKTRGLAKQVLEGRKKKWIRREEGSSSQNDGEDKNKNTYPHVHVYSGEDGVHDFLKKIIGSDGGRFKSLNGDRITTGWAKNVGIDNIIEFNNHIEKNDLVSDLISSKNTLINHVKVWGDQWTESFVNKPNEYHLLDTKYLEHGAQVFIRKDVVFLINIEKELVFEVKDKEIAKMITLLFDFVKDNTNKINIHDFLKKDR